MNYNELIKIVNDDITDIIQFISTDERIRHISSRCVIFGNYTIVPLDSDEKSKIEVEDKPETIKTIKKQICKSHVMSVTRYLLTLHKLWGNDVNEHFYRLYYAINKLHRTQKITNVSVCRKTGVAVVRFDTGVIKLSSVLNEELANFTGRIRRDTFISIRKDASISLNQDKKHVIAMCSVINHKINYLYYTKAYDMFIYLGRNLSFKH